MSDIVERLRSRGRELTQVGDGTLQGLVLGAADEIERLRKLPDILAKEIERLRGIPDWKIGEGKPRDVRSDALEEAAKVFDAWPTWDVWRSEAADTIRALKEKAHEPG